MDITATSSHHLGSQGNRPPGRARRILMTGVGVTKLNWLLMPQRFSSIAKSLGQSERGVISKQYSGTIGADCPQMP